MKDSDRPKAALISELEALRRKVVELEKMETERERVIRGLLQSNADLQAIFQAFPDLLFRVDAEGRILDYQAGRPAELYTPAEEFLGKRLQDVLPPSVGRRLLASIVHALETSCLVSTEYSLPMPEGEQIFEARLVPQQGEQVVAIIRNVTASKRSEAQLRQGANTLRSFILYSPDAVSLTNEDGSIIEWNPAQEKMTGLTKVEVQGRPLWEVLFRLAPPDLRARIPYEGLKALVWQILKTGQVPSEMAVQDRPIVRGDGEIRIIHSLIFTIDTAYGTMIGNIGRDITESRKAEEALRRSEALFKATFEGAAIGMALADRQGRLVRTNPAMWRLFGYSADELRDKTFADVTYPDDVSGEAKLVEELWTGKRDHYQIEKRYVRKDGQVIWGRLTASLVEPIGAQSRLSIRMIEDITDRKRSEDRREQMIEEMERLAMAAQRRAAELSGVIENMVDGVLGVDVQGRVNLVNQAALKMLGVDRAALLNSKLENLPQTIGLRRTVEHPIPLEEAPLPRALRGEVVTQADIVLYNPRQHRDVFIRINAAPIKDERGHIIGAVSVGRDVTEVIELEHLKEDFVRVAAHELKTPVAIVKGYAQALARTERNLPESSRRMLEAMERGSSRINEIVTELLDISRLQAGELELTRERVDLTELVRGAVEMTKRHAPRHQIRLISAGPTEVEGDRMRLEQVVSHLLNNAVTYSPRGGAIDVLVDVRDHEVEVSVKDYGVGIAMIKQPHIFERFYRAHLGTAYDFGGLGVGLYIAREIVRQHGGRMWFESQEGRGSSFHFALPLA